MSAMNKFLMAFLLLGMLAFHGGTLLADTFNFGNKVGPPWADIYVSDTLTIGPNSTIDSSLIPSAIDLSSPPPIGDVAPNTGDFTTLTASGATTPSLEVFLTANAGRARLRNTSASLSSLSHITDAGVSIFDVDAIATDGSSSETVRIGRAMASAATSATLWYDGTSNSTASLLHTSGNFQTDGSVTADDVVPNTDASYDLGTVSTFWRAAYIDTVYSNILQASSGNTLTLKNSAGGVALQHNLGGGYWVSSGALIPSLDSTYDLGLNTFRWADTFFDTLTLTTPLTDANVSDTLTSSLFVGSGSTTAAIDLATAEVAGVLSDANVSNDLTLNTTTTATMGHVNPTADSTYDLGLTGTRWDELFVGDIVATASMSIGTDETTLGTLDVYAGTGSSNESEIRLHTSDSSDSVEYFSLVGDVDTFRIEDSNAKDWMTFLDDFGAPGISSIGFGEDISIGNVIVKYIGGVTISSDSITASLSHLQLTSESSNADDVTSIASKSGIASVVPSTMELYLMPESGHTITIVDGGNIYLAGNADFVMNSVLDRIHLQQYGTDTWVEVSRSDNP